MEITYFILSLITLVKALDIDISKQSIKYSVKMFVSLCSRAYIGTREKMSISVSDSVVSLNTSD